MRARNGGSLLAIASRATPHLPSCIACSRHTLRLAFLANAARERGPVWARRSRGAPRRKTFSQVVQSAVDRFSASPYSPPTHDGHTTASNNSRGMEAAAVLPFQETLTLPTLRRRSSDRKSISHHHTHKEHVSGSNQRRDDGFADFDPRSGAAQHGSFAPLRYTPRRVEPDTSRIVRPGSQA